MKRRADVLRAGAGEEGAVSKHSWDYTWDHNQQTRMGLCRKCGLRARMEVRQPKTPRRSIADKVRVWLYSPAGTEAWAKKMPKCTEATP